MTDGMSGIDHGEYSGNVDRLGAESLGVRRFFFFCRISGYITIPERNGKNMKTNLTLSKWRNNEWVRAAIPALLIHCSIGTVYCWSIFSQEIADYIGFSKSATE